MTTHTVTPAQFDSLRPGDQITHFDGRPVGPFTVTQALHTATRTGVKAVEVRREGRTEPFNVYPDSLVADAITVERQPAATPARTGRAGSIHATSKTNAAGVTQGMNLIVEDSEFGLRSTRRKTGVQIAQVTGPTRPAAWRRRIIPTTLGDIDASAWEVFGVIN